MQHECFIPNARSCVEHDQAIAYTPIRFGDILFVGSGETLDEIGQSAVDLIREPACCGGDVIIFRPSVGVGARFLGYATDSPQAALHKATMGREITVMHIYWTALQYMTVARPSLHEQIAIACYLKRTITEINEGAPRSRRQISFIREYRTRFIADVVTGKLDVRELALRFHDEVEELELPAESSPGYICNEDVGGFKAATEDAGS